MKLTEILVTLFENPDGMTLSVTPNHSQGGKRVNFSFKGRSTHNNMKAYVDGIINIKDPKLQNYFDEQKDYWRNSVRTIVNFGGDCWLSKGYKSEGHKGKGNTVPAVAFLVRETDNWSLHLRLGPERYACDLEMDAVSASQKNAGAIAGHRWREAPDTSDGYSLDFMGGD